MKFVCGSIQFLRTVSSIIVSLRDFSALSKIPRKRKSNELEIWDWGSEQSVKKRYERAWAYISREDRDNDEGWKLVAARSEKACSIRVSFIAFHRRVARRTEDIWHFEAQRSIRDIFSVCIASPYCTHCECLGRTMFDDPSNFPPLLQI